MIRPLDHPERLRPGEYINRVRQPDATHSSTTRDFSYEIDEVERDQSQHREPDPEFGEDTYESSDESAPEDPAKRPPEPRPKPSATSTDASNLDITV